MSFVDVSNVQPSTLTTSSTITASGFEPNYALALSCTGGQIDASTTALAGNWTTSTNVTTSGTGTFVIAARGTSSSSFGGQTNVVVTAGNTSDTYTITTRNADTTPNTITFTNITGAERSTQYTSSTVTVTGLEPNIGVSVIFWDSTGGGSNHLVDAGTTSLSGTFDVFKSVTTSGSGTLVIAARLTTGTTFSTAYSITLNVSGSLTTFTVTTRAADTTPLAFTLTDALNQNTSTSVNTGIVTVSGLEPNTGISFSNAFLGFPGGVFVEWGTSTLGGLNSVSNGMGFFVTTSATGTFVIRLSTTTDTAFSTSGSGVVSLNGVSDTWNWSTRAPDTTGSFPAIFPSVTNAELSTLYTSTAQTVSGLEPNTTFNFSVSFGEITGGTSTVDNVWATSKSITTSGTGSAVLNIRRISSASVGTGTNGTISCNGTPITNGTFSITTRNADFSPDPFTFTDVTGAALNTTYTSNTLTITGLEPNTSNVIVQAPSGGLIDAGTTALSGTFATSKSITTSSTGTLVVAARVTSSSSGGTAVNCLVQVASGSDTYTVTTAAAVETITFSIGAGGDGGIGAASGTSGITSSASFRGFNLYGYGGAGGQYNNGTSASGGGYAGDSLSGGANGGNGGSATGDVGGGGGGGVAGGNALSPNFNGYGGQGGGFSSDPGGIKAALTAAGIVYNTVGGIGGSNEANPNIESGEPGSGDVGTGGGGAGWYGGNGGLGIGGGGGGGAAGYTTGDKNGGWGGNGWVFIKYLSGGSYGYYLTGSNTSFTLPSGSSNITVWVCGGGGGGAGSPANIDSASGGGGGDGGIAYKFWT
jgi:hypothetical protein